MPEPCHCQPLDVPNSEYIARALFYSFHVEKNGKLKWKAFQPDRGESDLSSMRAGCLTPTECKVIAKAMKDRGEYRGFAVISVEKIRDKHLDVTDSREIFCGHADIRLGIERPRVEDGEPEDESITQRIRELGKMLVSLSTTRLDTHIDQDTWHPDDPWVLELESK